MNDIAVVEAFHASAVVTQVDIGQRLYEAFLAGRSVNTKEAYARDMTAFARYLTVNDARSALQRLLSLGHGEANGLLLLFRAHMVDEGLTPSTINRRLSAVKSAVKLGRTLGLTTWVPEVDGLKCQSYRDTTGPGLSGTKSMLLTARGQNAIAAARDAVIIRLFFDLALRRAEVVGMDVDDVDFAARRIWFLGKGRTQKEWRTLPDKTLASLQAYPSRRLLSARVSAFLDYLKEAFPKGTPEELATYITA